jgi:hypothetical protein
MDIGLEVNSDKAKYMFVSRDQNAGRIDSVSCDNSSIESVGEYKYLGWMLTDPNSIHQQITGRLNLGNDCCHLVHNHLSTSFQSIHLKTKICRNIILSVVLYGCKTWSQTLREKRRQ